MNNEWTQFIVPKYNSNSNSNKSTLKCKAGATDIEKKAELELIKENTTERPKENIAADIGMKNNSVQN